MSVVMCPGGACPIKTDCHRYTAVPNEITQVFMAPPFGADTISTCDFFWDNWNQPKNPELEAI